MELEIIRDSADGQEVADCQRQLREVLEQCGIGEEAVEPRFYDQLLEEARSSG